MSEPDEYATTPDPRRLQFERLLPGPIERVWQYLTDDTLRGLWLASGPMQLVPGGAYEMSWRNDLLAATREEPPARFKDFHPTLRGRVLECESPRRLSYSWGEGPEASEVAFHLSRSGDRVRLILTHAKFPLTGLMTDSAAGWHAHLAILADRLAARPPRSFWRTWQVAREEYGRVLGDAE